MPESRLDALTVISAAAVDEVAIADPSASLDCAGWPIASDLIAHLGNHFGWVLATIGASERPLPGPGTPGGSSVAAWFASERDRFIETLTAMPKATPCWTLSGPGTLAFWHRRSTFEIARHVWDLRTAGGVRPPPPPELSAECYADGVTEHFDVFLERSRRKLEPLPGTLRLVATDTDASWLLSSDWFRPDMAVPDAVIEGHAGELALLCWERADALSRPELVVSGSHDVVRAFQGAPIHR
ncbi:MAG: maleylpyruvate isomerase N-terminal domain-containing protein [Actinomycetota bacterium]|nr:maleylpyruvate isomerase N-terminal domain-containing protein [Actinomycetota bacterium]